MKATFKNALTIDLNSNTINIPEQYRAKVSRPMTEENLYVMELMKTYNFKIQYVEKKKKEKAGKPSLSYSQMRTYIENHHEEDLKFFDNREINFVLQKSIYSATLKWFYKQYAEDEAIKNLLNINEDDGNKDNKMLPFNKPTAEENKTSDDVA